MMNDEQIHEFLTAVEGLQLPDPIDIRRGIPAYGIRIGGYGEYYRIPENQRPVAVVNVSDTFDQGLIGHPCYQWFPINELSPWGYLPFFSVKRMLDAVVTYRGLTVYLCCAAGAHRSVMMGFCWLLSLGKTEQEAAELMKTVYEPDYMIRMYRRDVERGYIPARLQEFYTVMNECPGICYHSVLNYMGIREWTDWERQNRGSHIEE
jgi:hypothetical protein